MSSIFFIKGASGFTNFKTKIYLIFVILMLSGRSSLYMTNPRIFKILKGSNLAKSNLSLNYMVYGLNKYYFYVRYSSQKIYICIFF